jgi:hypothetical protein
MRKHYLWGLRFVPEKGEKIATFDQLLQSSTAAVAADEGGG